MINNGYFKYPNNGGIVRENDTSFFMFNENIFRNMSNIIDSIKISGVTYDIQGSGGGGITVDPTLDSGSTNPVANSAITTALDAKVNVADNEVSGLTIAETAFYGVRYDYGRITDLYFKLANENITGNGTFYLYYHTSSSSNSWFGVSWAGIEGVLTSATVTNSSAVTATLEDGICHLSFDEGYSFSYIWKDYRETFDFWFYTDYNGGQSARVIEGSVSQAISDSYKEIKNVLDAKVNVADNVVSTKNIMYAYDAGDTNTKYLYNNGLRINQFFVSYSKSWNTTNSKAWSGMYITNGSTRSQIDLRVNASNYQITSVNSTSGDFTYTLEGGKVNITLPNGYYIDSLSQSPNFQILYKKYTIYGGQSASALENTDNVIQDIYNEVPKRFITGGSISCDSNYLYSYLYDNNGNSNSPTISLGTSIKGDGNRLDVYFDGQTIHQKILNTGNSSYCSMPNSPAWNYTDNLDEVIIHFNSGYTGSNTSYTIQVQTIEPNTNTYSDNLYYDVANHTLDASSANYVTATTVGDDYTYSIKPKQEYSSYKIVTIRENNWCNIGGIDNQRKEEYIITGVTTPSYSYQAQEIIDDLYSKVGGGNPTVELTQAEYDALVTAGTVSADTYYIITDAQAGDLTQYWTSAQTNSAITQAVSGKANSNDVYLKTETSGATQLTTAFENKQDTLVSGFNIKTINNESILGGGNIDIQGGGSTYTAGTGINITNDVISVKMSVGEPEGYPYYSSLNKNNSGTTTSERFLYNILGYGYQTLFDFNDVRNNQTSKVGYIFYDNTTTSTVSGHTGYGVLIRIYEYNSTNQLYYSYAIIDWKNKEIFFYNKSSASFDTSIVKTIWDYYGKNSLLLYTEPLWDDEGMGGQYALDVLNTSGWDRLTLSSFGRSDSKCGAYKFYQNGGNYSLSKTVYNHAKLTENNLLMINDINAALGGLKLVKLTQSAYDALSPNYDSNTLYVIVN